MQLDSDPDCGDPECFSVGPEALASAGALAPGAYTLEALAALPSRALALLVLLSLGVGAAGTRRPLR